MINGVEYVTLFADASYCKDTKLAGWAFWIKYDHLGKTITSRQSNYIGDVKNSTIAEILAIVQGIEFLIRHVPLTDKAIIIQSDCQPALDKMSEESCFKTLLSLNPKYVTLRHVRGHNGVKSPRYAVNTWCDTKAKYSMRQARDLLNYQVQSL